MTKPASEAAAFQAWGEVIAGIRFTGRPVVGIPGGENVPVGTVADLVRGGVLGDSAAPLLR